jgi:hypothetical protein
MPILSQCVKQSKVPRAGTKGRGPDMRGGCARSRANSARPARAAPASTDPATGAGSASTTCAMFNSAYDWFEGMSAEEILAAQHPAAGLGEFEHHARLPRRRGRRRRAALGRFRRSARRDRRAGERHPPAARQAGRITHASPARARGADHDGPAARHRPAGPAPPLLRARAALPPRSQRRRPQPRSAAPRVVEAYQLLRRSAALA